MTDQPAELKWDGAESLEWREAVDGWKWKSLGGGDWAKSGECVRCEHSISIVEADGNVARVDIAEADRQALIVGAAETRESADDEPEAVYARCNCSVAHPARPPELTRGCGRWGYINPPPVHD